MLRRNVLTLGLLVVASLAFVELAAAQQPTQTGAHAYGRSWGGAMGSGDWSRFYNYPYFYYPQNYWGQEYFKSSDSLYHRYPNEMRIPVYNRKWHNPYPSHRPYHRGHQFVLDVF